VGKELSPDAPFKRPAALAGIDPSAGRLILPVDPQLVKRLGQLGRMHGTSIYKIWLAAFVALFSLETDCSDVVVGAYVTRRRRPELRNMLGDFSNTVALRFKCNAHMSFKELLSQVGEAVLAAETYGEIPYASLAQEFGKLGIKLPDIRIIVAASTGKQLCFSGLKIDRHIMHKPLTMPWGCSVRLTERDGDYRSVVSFDAGLYDPALVGGFMERLYELLNSVSVEPGLLVGELRPKIQSQAVSDMRR
jgi:condensation domain-containing protein